MTQPETNTIEHSDVVCRINPLAAEKLMKILEMEAFHLSEEEAALVDFHHPPSFVQLALALDKENKLTILVIGLFLAAAYALKDSEIILHAVTVAAYGIAALITLWLIHGLLGARPTPVLATAGGPSLPVTSAAAPDAPEPEHEPPHEPPAPPAR